MCDICLRTPCDSRCPNAPEPLAVYTCKYCEDDILEGEDYFELDGEYYHEGCFEDNAVEILLKDYGATKGVAEADDGYDD